LVIDDLVRERGPMTVAAFMDLALYDAEFGYYARAAQRSGRAGDFFTSVDVGAIFGELLEIQVAEMASLLESDAPPEARSPKPEAQSPKPEAHFDLVEAGAGNGRLSADILRAARRRHPHHYDGARLHLVEASPEARAAQRTVLGDVADRLVDSSDRFPSAVEGVVVANELVDALPVHQVVMGADGLNEMYVTYDDGLVLVEGPASTPELQRYLDRLGVSLEPGWRVEINLRAVEWIRDVARRLRRGFVIVIDYGHEARELYSITHSAGTLTAFARHTMAGPADTAGERRPAWLLDPGERDLTAHVDFTSLRASAEAEGLTTLGFLDQTYFLLGLVAARDSSQNLENPANLGSPANLKQNLALRTLLMPGGLGSTHKVLILGKGVGTPSLAGCSFRMRVT
jgi:SAM-dependent MidA family methyltransferase